MTTKPLLSEEKRELFEALYLADPPTHPLLRYIAHAVALEELERAGPDYFQNMPVFTLMVSGSQSLPTTVRRPSDLDLTVSLRSHERSDWEKAGETMKLLCQHVAACFGGSLSELSASNRRQYSRARDKGRKMQALLDEGMQRFYITVPIRAEMIHEICEHGKKYGLNNADIRALENTITQDSTTERWRFRRRYLKEVQAAREAACQACGGNNEALRRRYIDQFCNPAHPELDTGSIQVVIAIEAGRSGLPPLGVFNEKGQPIDITSPGFKGITYQHPLVETAKKAIAVLEGPDNPNFPKHLFDFYVRTSPKDMVLASLDPAVARLKRKSAELTPALKSLIVLLMPTHAVGHTISNLAYPPMHTVESAGHSKFGNITQRLRRLYKDGIISGIETDTDNDINQLAKLMLESHRNVMCDTFGHMSAAEEEYTKTWRNRKLPTLEMVREVAQPFLSMLEQQGQHIDIKELHQYIVTETMKARPERIYSA